VIKNISVLLLCLFAFSGFIGGMGVRNSYTSILFNASTEHVDVADNAKWDFTPVSQTRTMHCQWRVNTLPSASDLQMFWELYTSTGNKLFCIFANNGGTYQIVVLVYNSSWSPTSYFATDGLSLTTNKWYNITIVLTSQANNKIYIDGVSQSLAANTWVDSTAIATTDIFFGGSTTQMSGACQIKHWAVFSDELTTAEIAYISNNPYAFDNNANIICSIHCDENTGSTANDVQTVATQTDGTINGATWAN